MEIVVTKKCQKNFLQEYSIDLKNIPKHIAIIMDGNRRWAKNHSLDPRVGHWKGAEVIDKIVEFSADIGVETLTVFAFSTENWNRSESEVSTLIHLFEVYLKKNICKMASEGVKLETIGDLSRFPGSLLQIIEEAKFKTKNCNKISLVLALNYGARDEITRAVKRIVEDVELKKIHKDDLTENLVSSYLDTASNRDPDLLIRTSGENRLSNFMLWQLSYTEVYITDTHWPDFKEEDLLSAVKVYQNRDRRFGE